MSRRAALVAAVAVGSLVAPLSPAFAARDVTPEVTISYAHSHITAFQDIDFTVSAAGVPGATLKLQMETGTKDVFETVKTLPAQNGSFSAPGLEMGRYDFRVIASRDKHPIAVSATHKLYFYGSVTAAALCKDSRSAMFTAQCTPGTIQVGTFVFQYAVVTEEHNKKANGQPDVEAIKSSCRRATITYAVSNEELNVTKFGMSFTQTKMNEQSYSATPGTIGTAVFKINSTAWDLESWTNTGDNLVWAGNFSCWSAHGYG